MVKTSELGSTCTLKIEKKEVQNQTRVHDTKSDEGKSQDDNHEYKSNQK